MGLDVPIELHNLSRTGFAVVSEVAFTPGATLDFHIEGPDNLTCRVSAVAVRSGAVPGHPDRFVSGFAFVPAGDVLGVLPVAAIERLIAAVEAAQPLLSV